MSSDDRIVRARPGLAGSVFAVLFYCASLTPSLLPRAWYLQGIVSGLTAAIGYGVGATLGALVRLAWRRTYPRATRIPWWALLIAAPLAGLTMLALGTKWQQELQYSYLPSWISFLVDRSKVSDSATALIGAVHARWAALPAATRPRIWDPAFTGGTVEFTQRPADLRTPTGIRPAVVYLQNSSDPIVWWSPELMFQHPEWLDDPRGPDVSPDMHWYPMVAFWQTTVDQVFAINVPAGHGHVYGSGVVDGWAALAPPPGWTGADSVRLRSLLDRRP